MLVGHGCASRRASGSILKMTEPEVETPNNWTEPSLGTKCKTSENVELRGVFLTVLCSAVAN